MCLRVFNLQCEPRCQTCQTAAPMGFQTSQPRRQGGFQDTFLQLPPRFIMQLILIILPSVNRLTQQSARSLLYSPPLPTLSSLLLFPPFIHRLFSNLDICPLIHTLFIITFPFTLRCHFTLCLFSPSSPLLVLSHPFFLPFSYLLLTNYSLFLFLFSFLLSGPCPTFPLNFLPISINLIYLSLIPLPFSFSLMCKFPFLFLFFCVFLSFNSSLPPLTFSFSHSFFHFFFTAAPSLLCFSFCFIPSFICFWSLVPSMLSSLLILPLSLHTSFFCYGMCDEPPANPIPKAP